jgi:hypothetical protein
VYTCEVKPGFRVRRMIVPAKGRERAARFAGI